MRRESGTEAIAAPATVTICWIRASGWVHSEPGNVCIIKGSEDREKKNGATGTAVDADQVGCDGGDGKTATPLTADRFVVAVPGAEDQDTHESRSGVKHKVPYPS